MDSNVGYCSRPHLMPRTSSGSLHSKQLLHSFDFLIFAQFGWQGRNEGGGGASSGGDSHEGMAVCNHHKDKCQSD